MYGIDKYIYFFDIFIFCFKMNYMNNINLRNALYYKYINHNLFNDIRISVVGYERCKSNKPTLTIKKPLYTFHVILNGFGHIEFDNTKTVLGPGSCFLIPPNKTFIYKQDNEKPWEYIWFEFDGDAVPKLLANTNFAKEYFFKITSFNTVLKTIDHYKNIYTKRKKDTDTIYSTSFLLDIFASLINDCQRKIENTDLNKHELKIIKIKRYIEDNYNDPDLNIAIIANHFYFTQSYLTRLFKKYAKITPIQYLIKIRMEKASELLSQNNFSVLQVAESVGYKNQFYFSKEFKNYYGIVPSKYKNLS